MLQLPQSRARRLSLLLLSAFYVGAGINHFVNPDFYVSIVPSYLPAHLTLVYLSGVLEVLGGLAVLVPRLRSIAGWALILLLLAVFPANVYMAQHPERFPSISAFLLYARLSLQFLLIAWAYWATRSDTGLPSQAA